MFFAIAVAPLAGCSIFSSRVDVLLIGDSIMNQAGDFVLAQLRKDQALDDVKVRKEAVNGSGLLTPNIYNWQVKAEDLVKQTTPKIVVVLFIGNYSDTDLFVGSDGRQIPNTYQDDFFAAWKLQAVKLTKMLEANGSRVDWVLPPPLNGSEGDRREKLMRETYVALAREDPGVGLIDGRQALGGPNGEFTWKLPDIAGREQVIRQADSVHLTDAGGQLLARKIALDISRPLIELRRQASNA